MAYETFLTIELRKVNNSKKKKKLNNILYEHTFTLHNNYTSLSRSYTTILLAQTIMQQ